MGHTSKSNASLSSQQLVSQIIESFGHTHFGLTPLATPISLTFYKQWLQDGYHGQMKYLESHLPQKENPELILPEARSAIVIGFNYLPHPKPQTKSALRIAYYARGEDYHAWVQEKLEQIVTKLKDQFANEYFLSATDSKPVLERDLAYRAGLGWVGKNTCVIDQARGSFFLLGEILTTLDFSSPLKALHPDRCGTCTRCIDACPTSAILEPRKIDARKCISYLTIESKEVPPLNLRQSIGDNFFGCDICQTVCPWNEKAFGEQVKAEQAPQLSPSHELAESLKFILESSNKELERHFADSPLLRARGFGLKRNAIIVAANQKQTALTPQIAAYVQDQRLGELAKWALAELLNS